MGVFFDSIYLDILGVSTILVLIFYVNNLYSYWHNLGVPQLKASFPFGNVGNLLRNSASFSETVQILYEEMKSYKWPFGGFYFGMKGDLMLLDPELIKSVLNRDFSYFNSRGQPILDHDSFTKHLFALPGQQWRNLRHKLTPAFTAVKLKSMFITLHECGIKFGDELSTQEGVVDINDFSEKFTIDAIVSCAFGLEANCLSNTDNEFKQIGNLIFNPKRIDKIKQNISYAWPEVFKFFKISLINKRISHFFTTMTESTVDFRERNNVERKDFLQLLIQMKNKGSVDDDGSQLNGFISKTEIAAQSYIFFLAGFETSSSTITFCLYELSRNLDIQEKLREEILQMLQKTGGEITYDALMEMDYLDKVVSETLRKYPPLPFLNRQCIKDYRIPNTEIILQKGPSILISILGMHRDPEYYPEPDKFDPERFSEKEVAKRHPFTYLPFGEGPRMCIGMRFGLMQTKLGLAVLLRRFRFTLNSKTEVPLVMSKKSFTMRPLNGVWLNLEELDTKRQ